MIDKHIKHLEDFKALQLTIATPDDILEWSSGEILKPETINYRTQKPEPGGLFCQRIFGPVKNWECACGKYKRIRYKGIVCEKCGVEVIRSVVRRERMGHIKLAVPVAHPWFMSSSPSKIGTLLDIAAKKLEQVVYFASYIITNVSIDKRKEVLDELQKTYDKQLKEYMEEAGLTLKEAKTSYRSGDLTESEMIEIEKEMAAKKYSIEERYKADRALLNGLSVGHILHEIPYREAMIKFGHVFRAGTGAEAIREILMKIDLEALSQALTTELQTATNDTKKKKIAKRLRLINALLRTHFKPEHMMLTVLPVMPPDLRPMVQLDGGRFATSDLNDLYRRVINRNMRLKKLIQLGAPDIICRNEKRMLQESIDTLISGSTKNSRAGVSYLQKRKLKSLSDMLKGKQGRFRANLLGKRVDYSGRSVIVVGPTLKLDECGLPKYMSMELFKPFVLGKLIEYDMAQNVKAAERLIKDNEPIVWDILADEMKGKYVLLNRAPTLHRMGIQAFKPHMVDGKAIQIHPLVCEAFNADFDGDQMAVHLPLSVPAQQEAREIMNASKNLLKPAHGKPIVNPRQDVILGLYFLTDMNPKARGNGMKYPNVEQAKYAYNNGSIDIQAPITVRINGEMIDTTVGRIMFNEVLPTDFPYQNEVLTKKRIQVILARVLEEIGTDKTVSIVDTLKTLGFTYAKKSGMTISAFDYMSIGDKRQLLDDGQKLVKQLQKDYERGLITNEERYKNVIQLWHRIKNTMMVSLQNEFKKEVGSDIVAMVDSGSRGDWSNVMSVAGMKGIVMSTSGKAIEMPISSSMLEGYGGLEYFIGCYAGRKGKADTALKTAQAGYLTRRLVDSVQDSIVREIDCHTDAYKYITREDSKRLGMDFEKRIFGRTVAADIKHNKKVILEKNEIIDNKVLRIIASEQLDNIPVRTTMLCHTHDGVCQKCYGYDLGSNKPVEIGTPVGIIAAQSIGEPGTQLTMRTYHQGGVATETGSMTDGLTRVEELFEARTPKFTSILADADGLVTVRKSKAEVLVELLATTLETTHYTIPVASTITVKVGDEVKEKQVIAKDIETKKSIKASVHGRVKSVDRHIITIEELEPRTYEYSVPTNKTVIVRTGDIVKKGQNITIGHADLRELMELTNVQKTLEYILSEVLSIYESQGQSIHEKHVELVVKQMVSRTRVIDGGDTGFLASDLVSFVEADKRNKDAINNNKQAATIERQLLGLTEIGCRTDSWLAAASFQQTVRVLVDAAVMHRTDVLDGLKENVIIGRLIPAGDTYKDMVLDHNA